MQEIDYKYHQGSHAPDWFEQSNRYHYAITAGTSPFNEYYGFNNDDDVHKLVWIFKSQSFIDGFVFVDEEEYWYDYEDVNEHLNDDECSVYYTAKPRTSPADARSMLEAESRF
tara:strand:+ start:109 stop:447 length:339 start_codon:yes stop_codon:yes gene_type:complete